MSVADIVVIIIAVVIIALLITYFVLKKKKTGKAPLNTCDCCSAGSKEKMLKQYKKKYKK